MPDQHMATYFLFPEVMLGISKKVMMHADGVVTNTAGVTRVEGAGAYLKYRFFSKDGLHRHYRMAAFSRFTSNRMHQHYDEINSYGMHSGYQLGAVGTQLLHKTALSGTAYYEQALGAVTNYYGNRKPARALNYSLSCGHLFLPVHYRSYRQTNLNIMVELLGQQLTDAKGYYLDIAPSVQLIFNSQTRVDVGYRKELNSNMYRGTTESILLRIEHLLYQLK